MNIGEKTIIAVAEHFHYETKSLSDKTDKYLRLALKRSVGYALNDVLFLIAGCNLDLMKAFLLKSCDPETRLYYDLTEIKESNIMSVPATNFYSELSGTVEEIRVKHPDVKEFICINSRFKRKILRFIAWKKGLRMSI